ncbi:MULTISPECIES: peptide chain release factor N(5)-glutamine methyltransferase [Methylotenera]|uniref:peptide chain release factor N(5)-glutamine methyltransferase n=1 Tax=Methylotenera TaxID=359407 RepID=UPI000380BE80|nr:MULTISPECIES: peptide chain release factor N(5)-glutamine methyltransferase [Methylotenera]
MQSNTIIQLIQSSQTELNIHLNLNLQEAKFEAQLLLLHVLNKDRSWLIAHENEIVQADTDEKFQTLLNRRLNGEPIAYILGYREFYGLHLKVTPDTLIPRPDTETLVEAALSKIPSRTFQHETLQAKSVLDLGTGTGAIALAIAKNRSLADVIAVDVSQAALNIAIENAKNLTIYNVQFLLSDWFGSLNERKFDLIVSNPPYIEDDDVHLKQGDLRFEPQSALASGYDGLKDIRQIIDCAPKYLNTGGWLMLEHGYNQAPVVAALFKQAGFVEISHVLDLSGIERVTIGRF